MKLDDLLQLTDEEKEKFPYVNAFVDYINNRDVVDDYFESKEDFLNHIESFFNDFALFENDVLLKCIMLGDIPFPMPNRVGKWEDDELDRLHKRYRIIKKMNRISR